MAINYHFCSEFFFARHLNCSIEHKNGVKCMPYVYQSYLSLSLSLSSNWPWNYHRYWSIWNSNFFSLSVYCPLARERKWNASVQHELFWGGASGNWITSIKINLNSSEKWKIFTQMFSIFCTLTHTMHARLPHNDLNPTINCIKCCSLHKTLWT